MSEASGAPIRIVVADDHPVVRDGLVAMLRAGPEFDVVGEATNGVEAVRLVQEKSPDVLLLDLEMPGLDGVAVLRRLRELDSPTRAIVFTVFDTDERIIAAVEAGAKGYLLKGVPRAEIFAAIRAVHAGGSLLQPVVAARVLEHVASRARGGDALSPEEIVLTPRESDVLQLLARGRSNKQIAATLGVSEKTVRNHITHIYAKLEVENRAQAIVLARNAGFGRS